MTDDNLPPSLFLRNCLLRYGIDSDDPLTRLPYTNDDIACLLSLTKDDDIDNRDWATFLLAASPFDTLEIRTAFKQIADNDSDYGTRDQALTGLASREPAAALERVSALLKDECTSRLLQVAGMLADPELLPLLREIESWEPGDCYHQEWDSDVEHRWLTWAISRCESRQPSPSNDC